MNISHWSIRHPIGISMIILSLILLGSIAFSHLKTTLLPQVVYPDIRVRVLSPGVPAKIMEDQITRQLEEQLAITEGVNRIRSTTSEGRSAVNLSFSQDVDIDQALQDASTRLDRAKRFLPDNIQQPIIYKRDPSQIPVIEIIVSSTEKDPVALRQWSDYVLSKYFITLEGVASVEVGGGMRRQIHIIIDQQKLSALGLSLDTILEQIRLHNKNESSGRLLSDALEFSTYIDNQFQSVDDIRHIPIRTQTDGSNTIIYLKDIARIIDSHEIERMKIRLNGHTGIKLSIQKQPQANTIEVVKRVRQRILWLQQQGIVAADIDLQPLNDQAVFIQYAVDNAGKAAIYGSLMAMLIVWLFLRDWKKTLIIGSAIPIAVLMTLFLMQILGLSLNLMSLGGLALGIGMLVDNTIVMLEHINKHQLRQRKQLEDNHGQYQQPIFRASSEIYTALIASTSTNLAAILPFLFIGGVMGMFFSDLILTISAAIVASLCVSLGWVPAMAAAFSVTATEHSHNKVFNRVSSFYRHILSTSFRYRVLTLTAFLLLLFLSISQLQQQKQIFLPKIDEGRVTIGIKGETGMPFSEMDMITEQVEKLLEEDPQVKTIVTTSGGFIFGRSQFQRSNRSSIKIQLYRKQDDFAAEHLDSKSWIKNFRKKLKKLHIPGVKFWMRVDGVRGIRLGSSSEDIEIRIKGDEITLLAQLGEQLIEQIKQDSFLNQQLKNLGHSYENDTQQLVIKLNPSRIALLGLDIEQTNQAIKASLEGLNAGQLIEKDQATQILLKQHQYQLKNIDDIKNIRIANIDGQAVYLYQLADVRIQAAPYRIIRESQQRMNEISASLVDDNAVESVKQKLRQVIQQFEIPDGYSIYLADSEYSASHNTEQGLVLLAIAIFLVFSVMAIQYESVKNPLIILLGIPFTLTGISLVIQYLDLPLSMPVWLGVIMLTGIVVNNSIVLLEQIELEKKVSGKLHRAIFRASSQRLKAIMMTTLTTIFGLLPLAMNQGEGTEMLQPLAIVMIAGLSYAILVSLILIPNIYYYFYRK